MSENKQNGPGRVRGNGIALAGNLIADVVKTIDVYPQSGQLANVSRVSRSVGGCVPNTALDLAGIDPNLTLSAFGRVGDDENGAFLLEKLRGKKIDVSGVRICPGTKTSFCDVMSVPGGERTFFSYRGANAGFCPEDVDVGGLTCSIFHVGYLLLLDRFDAPDPDFGTVMARFLSGLRERGIRTSIDVVSSSNAEEYARTVRPSLSYVDYMIVNEWECCRVWNLSPRKADGTLDQTAIRTAMEKCIEYGVKEKVIVHAKEGGFCLSRDGGFSKIGALMIPKAQIKGSVGAGDAFCAGALYSIGRGDPDERILAFSVSSAACSLFEENSVDGMRGAEEIEKLPNRYGFNKI